MLNCVALHCTPSASVAKNRVRRIVKDYTVAICVDTTLRALPVRLADSLSGLSDAPLGVALSFAFSGRTLLVGTAPQVVQRAAETAPADSLSAAPGFRHLLGSRLASPSHAAYANLAALRRWLTAEGDRIAIALSGNKEGGIEEARRGLEQLALLLALADSAAAAAQFEPSGIRFVASVRVECD